MKTIMSVNGAVMPCEPMSMIITKSDLYSDSSKRSAETGRLMLYPIRYDVVTIDLEYLLTEGQSAEVEDIIRGSELDVQYYDNGKVQNCKMYPSDRSKQLVGTAENRKYRLTFSLVQI